jgi:crossover junction endodeoxyribonuclease RuvC
LLSEYIDFAMISSKPYRILGLDPGTNYMGYGVLEVEGKTLRAIVLGDIDLHKLSDPYDKLRYIFERVKALVGEYMPAEVALESPFFGKNVQSMLKLGRAQGVAMAAALSCNKPVAEYAPTRIKQAITGTGSASKEQVAAIVTRMLKIEDAPRRLDATDGMAVALAHYYSTSSPINQALGDARIKGLGGEKAARKRGSQSWEQFVSQNPKRVKE